MEYVKTQIAIVGCTKNGTLRQLINLARGWVLSFSELSAASVKRDGFFSSLLTYSTFNLKIL